VHVLTRSLALLLLPAAVTGCLSLPVLGPVFLLARADTQTREGAWEAAVASYDEYLARYPDDSSAPRVLERRDTLAATLSARAELTRRRDEVARLRDELAGLRDQEARLRKGGTRLRSEVTVLRDEVIRLHDERAQLREELSRRERDLARTRQELAARRAEAERLRSDIERLKQIDLQLERKR
jgi:chromosome segregation ATPase